MIQFYFYPDISAVAQLLGDILSKTVEDSKYDVTVFCGRSLYADKKNFNYKTTNYKQVRIKRIITTNFGRKSFITRILDFIIFYVSIFFYFLFNRNWNIVIAMTSPPLIGFIVAIATALTKIPLVLYIQDLFPELLYDIGYIEKPWLIRKLKRLNDIIIWRASRVITIGEYMTKKIINNYRINIKKIYEINNWTSGIKYVDRERKREFILLYSGNMGLAHDFSKLNHIIRGMKDANQIQYRFIGGGEENANIVKIFKREGENRVIFSGYTDRSEHIRVISDADIFIIAQKRETIGDILPSKIYSYLAAGRPILYLGSRNSEIGKLIINNDIGVILETEDDVRNALNYIKRLVYNQKLCINIGRRASSIFNHNYKLCYSVDKFKHLLETLS